MVKKNVLPGNVTMKWDARALSKETNEKIASNILQIVEGVCNAHGVNGSVKYETACPVTFNSKIQADAATKAAISLLGNDKCNGDIEPCLFSEDFSMMTSEKPGCFILMGNGTSEQYSRPLHADNYDFNDELLGIGSSYWTELV